MTNREEPPFPPVAGVVGLVAGVSAAVVLARSSWDVVVRELPDTAATVLGWLPLGGFLTVLGAVLASAAGTQPRWWRGVQAALLGAWAAIALLLTPGRYASDAVREELTRGGPAFERALGTAAPVLVAAVLLMTLVVVRLSGGRYAGLLRGGRLHLLLLVVPSVAVLAVLELLVVV